MALEHQHAASLDVAAAQGVGEVPDACVLGHDVPRDRVAGNLLGRRVAQRHHPEPGRGGLARSAPLRVRALLEPARHTAVHDDDRDGLGQRDRRDLERATVEQQRVAGLPEDRRHLIHHATRHPARGVLGIASDEREVEAVEWHPRDAVAHASVSATANAALDDRPDPTGTSDAISASSPIGSAAPRGEHSEHGRHHSSPRGETVAGSTCPSAGNSTVPSISRERTRTRPSGRASKRTRDIPVDRHGEAQPVLIVGVVADEVHPAGRARRRAREGIYGSVPIP